MLGRRPRDMLIVNLELHEVVLDSAQPDLPIEPRGEPFKPSH